MKNLIKRLRKIDVFFALIVVVKVLSFYLLTGLSLGGLVVGLVTISIIGVSFYSFVMSHKKGSWKTFFIIYTVISLLMVIDACYYSYFNQLISINQVFQVNKLIVVNESFKFVMPPIGVLLVVDVPFVAIYVRKLKKTFGVPKEYTKYIKHKRIATAVIFGAVFLFVINPFKADTVKAINHNEIITYHIYDIYTNIFGEEDNVIESEADVQTVLAANQPKTEGPKNNTGIGKGKNLILIQVESLQNFVVDAVYDGQEVTPNLNQLAHDTFSLYFNNYYQTIGKGNTSDAEFSSLNGIYPNLEGSVYEKFTENTFYGLPWVMKENGYSTIAFHGYEGAFWNREEAYPYQGFDDFISAEDFEIKDVMGFGMVDKDMLAQTADHLATMPKPFFSFIITLSSHHPYLVPDEFSTFNVRKEDEGSVFGNYLESIHYVDEALGQFIEDLKAKDLYDDSVIVLYGDHFALNAMTQDIHEDMSAFLGKSYDYDEMLNIPLLIHVPGEELGQTIETTGGEVDLFPTVANIMGTEIHNPYVFGKDLLNTQGEGFVASVTYMLRGSFVNGKTIFEFSQDTIYEKSRAWNVDTMEPIRIDGLKDEYTRAKNVVDASKYVLENNLIQR